MPAEFMPAEFMPAEFMRRGRAAADKSRRRYHSQLKTIRAAVENHSGTCGAGRRMAASIAHAPPRAAWSGSRMAPDARHRHLQ
jgi:hypothetical protein